MSSLKRAFGTDDVAPFLSKCTLRAVAGDVAQDRLGLPEPFYAFLAHNVTDIVHCAAHVNHAMPFGNSTVLFIVDNRSLQSN